MEDDRGDVHLESPSGLSRAAAKQAVTLHVDLPTRIVIGLLGEPRARVATRSDEQNRVPVFWGKEPPMPILANPLPYPSRCARTRTSDKQTIEIHHGKHYAPPMSGITTPPWSRRCSSRWTSFAASRC